MKQPREWNADDRDENARYMANVKTTSELREYQRINALQTSLAYRNRNEHGLLNLQAMADVYAAAIGYREFSCST